MARHRAANAVQQSNVFLRITASNVAAATRRSADKQAQHLSACGRHHRNGILELQITPRD
jgi:hypothetical protein